MVPFEKPQSMVVKSPDRLRFLTAWLSDPGNLQHLSSLICTEGLFHRVVVSITWMGTQKALEAVSGTQQGLYKC